MKALSIAFYLLLSASGLAQLSKAETLDHRAEHEAELQDTSLHMMDSLERSEWQGLDYFEFDTTYQITARFKKRRGKKFEMPTSTDRLPVYRRFGFIYFTIEGEEHRLTVYQNVELTKKEGYENYLFIPFRDATSGKETYGGGRYLDVRIPEEKELFIDFNQCYNPYCAYSHKWSCPIPPAENTLKTSIKAGEKNPLAH